MMKNDYQVVSYRDNFCCIGCGLYYTYDTMKAYEEVDTVSSEYKILKALKITSNYNPFVRGPFEILKINIKE